MKKFSIIILGIILAALFLLGACSSLQRAQEPFTVDLSSNSYAVGSTEIQFDKVALLGSLRKETVEVTYYPADDAACLEFRADFVTYNQFWSRQGRDAFVAAVERYKEDYSGRSLANSSRTKRAYGSVQGFLSWKTLRFSGAASGNPRMELGYCFKNKNPYFLVTMHEAEYKDKISNSNSRTSAKVMLYFTRAQAESLATLFDQNHLQGPGRMGNSSAADTDEYMER
ncbi:MAG: hypothetical protein LBI06_05090 [Treponema sp.]|jgi:hypothetical protein|nr:hypothetical protein [Treponema sp.]